MQQIVDLVEDLSGYVGNYGRISSLDELKQLVDVLYRANKTISFDIETGYTGPDRAGTALDPYHPLQFIAGFAITNDVRWARYVPVKHDFGTNLDPNVVWEIMKPLLEEREVTCYNIVFEATNLSQLNVKGDGPAIRLNPGTYHDPMLQSYVLSETKFHGLKFKTRTHFNYEQAEIHSLYDKALTAGKQRAIRFNPLDVDNPAVINYVCDDVTWALRLDQHFRPRALAERNFIYRLELGITDILVDMKNAGIAVDWDGINEGLAQYDQFYSRMESRTRKMFEDATGRDLTALNFRSHPQMRTLIFDPEEGLGLSGRRMTKSDNPQLSTDETALTALASQHPAIDQLLKYRQTKKMGEFFENWSKLNGSVDGKVHPNFKQTTVQSGRFACDSPNVQNIRKSWWYESVDPGDLQADIENSDEWKAYLKENGTNGVEYWGGNAREYLIASPGFTILTFDYSQQELRVLAGLAKEPYLIESFEKGIDIHKATAALMFNVDPDDVTDELRARGKTINFGNVYGQGPKALGDQLGITKDEAQQLFDKYFSAFSKVADWFTQVKRQGMQTGYVESFFGRKSTIWELRSEYPSVRNKAERMFVNVPVQGGGADITKIAMIQSKKAMVKKGWWMDKVRLLMNQHDSLVFEVSNDLDLAEVKAILQPCVSFPIKGFPPFKVDWESGPSWGGSKKWEDDSKPVEEKTEPAQRVAPDTSFVKVVFSGRPAPEIAQSITGLIKNNPGNAEVTFVLGGESATLKIKVNATEALASEIVAIGGGTIEVEMA